MKTIVTMMALAIIATTFDLDLAALGLILVAFMLALGDYFGEDLPESLCTHDCNQARACTCRKMKEKTKP